MDYLANEPAEIHPRVEEASNARSRPGGVGERSPLALSTLDMYLPLSKILLVYT